MKVIVKGKEFYINQYLKENLDFVKKAVKKKWDDVFLIDGREGVAKSTLAKMCGYYLSEGNFSVNDIVFTSEQFMEAVDKAKPNTAIVFDEMVMAGMSADALSGMQKALIKKFTLIRKKQLHIILVIPYVFMLQKYFSIARTSFLLHCYSPDGMKRGYFKFYNQTEKNYLYMLGVKFWNYNTKCNYSFHGMFTDYTGMFIDEKAYEAKKDAATKEISGKSDTKLLIPTKKQAQYLMEMEVAAVYDSNSAAYRALLRYKEKLKSFYLTTDKVLSDNTNIDKVP